MAGKKKPKSPAAAARRAASARFRARLAVGPVKPSHPITPKPLRPPKYKKKDIEDLL